MLSVVDGRQSVRTLDRGFEDIDARYDSPAPMVEFHSTAKFRDRFPTLLAEAREEIYFAGTPVIATHAILAEIRERLLVALDRHVRVTILEDFESLETQGRTRLLHELRARGADIRVSSSATIGMVIIDRQCAMVCKHSLRDRHCCVSIRSRSILALLQQLADSTWRAAWDLDLIPLLQQRDGAILLEVMRLLAAGYKDELGARTLGVSLRTYRRHVAELLQALDAGSRFEAGVRAAKLGLLP